MSFHPKRGTSFPHYPFQHQHGHNSHHSPQHSRPHHYSKPKRKRRKGNKKLGSFMGKPPFIKMPFRKRPKKSHIFPEMFHPTGPLPYSKMKFMNPTIKDYLEEEEFFANPFSTAENVESFPSTFSEFGRPPPSIVISDDGPEGIPSLGPIEEEFVIPGSTNIKPFSSLVKKPSQFSTAIFSPTKPPDIYMEEDLQSSIRNIRLAKPQHNNYVDKDIVNLLTKLKSEGLHLDSKPPAEQPSRENVTDVNAAISKLLQPFLSETAVKQIQSYFNGAPNDKRHSDDKNLTKVVYIIENNEKDLGENISNHRPYRSYSITDPIHENDTNNTTYFIMVKSPHSSNSSASFSQRGKKYTTLQSEVKSTATPPTMESLALQNYIMSLAGIRSSTENYLPRFSSFPRQFEDNYNKK